MRLPRIAEPLRHRDFRLLWTGQTLSLLGSFVSNIAYPFQILQLGGSAVELGTLVSLYAGSSRTVASAGWPKRCVDPASHPSIRSS